MVEAHGAHNQQEPAHVRAMSSAVFKRSLGRSGMGPEAFVQALVRTSLSRLTMWTESDLDALLLGAERYGLDPLGREIFLIQGCDPLTDPAVLVLGVDGWSRILNSHKKFAGIQFRQSEELVDGVPSWIECTLHRWDRRVPTRVREYYQEVRGASQPWLTHPRRMLRHKALVQCARLAFGVVGVYDQDEAQGSAANKRLDRPVSSARDEKAMGKRVVPMGVEALRAQLAARRVGEAKVEVN